MGELSDCGCAEPQTAERSSAPAGNHRLGKKIWYRLHISLKRTMEFIFIHYFSRYSIL